MSNQDVDIWMPVYIGDMLAKTTRMTTEQIGASFLLMMDYWRNGAIPDDNNVIASVIRLNIAKAKALKNALINCNLFEVIDGQLTSQYLDGLKAQAESNKSAKSDRAKKAAEARWGNKQESSNTNANNEHNPSNAHAHAHAMHKQCLDDAKSMLEECPSSSPSSINNTHSNTREENSLDDDLNLWKPQLDQINAWRQRAGLPVTTQQEFDQTMITFLPYYAPQIRTSRMTENQIYSKYIAWVKRDNSNDKPKTGAKSKPEKPKQTGLNVNEAWNKPQEPVVYNEAVLPELTEQDLEEWM